MKKFRQKIRCFFGRHELAFFVRWAPTCIFMQVGCEHCGIRLAHIQLPMDPKHRVERFH